INGSGKAGDHDTTLWIYTKEVDEMYRLLKSRQIEAVRTGGAGIDFVEHLNDTFYGAREFGIRDPNGYRSLFHPLIFGFCLARDGQVGIGILPQRQKFVVGMAGPDAIAGSRKRTRELQAGYSAHRIVADNPAPLRELAKFHGSFRALVQFEQCQPSQVWRIQSAEEADGDTRGCAFVILRRALQGLECPARSTLAAERHGGPKHRHVVESHGRILGEAGLEILRQTTRGGEVSAHRECESRAILHVAPI